MRAMHIYKIHASRLRFRLDSNLHIFAVVGSNLTSRIARMLFINIDNSQYCLHNSCVDYNLEICSIHRITKARFMLI